MVLWCALASGMTAPGQTIGVSAFVDDMIDSLDTSRSAVATAYLVGTLGGAMALPMIGRWIDRAGVRHTVTVIAVAFAGVIAYTSTVQNIVMLGLAFVGLRMLGQGSLTLASSTGVVIWFDRHRGLALALYGMGGLGLISLAPLTFGLLIDGVGWRPAWLVLAAVVLVTLVPLARVALVDRPEDLGQIPDGVELDPGAIQPTSRSFTVAEAMRTPAFWTLGALSVLVSSVVTGLTFHNVDLLAEQGFSEEQAAAVFIPQLVGSACASFGFGWMTDRLPARPLMFVSGLALALGTWLATITEPGLLAVTYGITLGIGMGAISAVVRALYPKWFGVNHIGAIRGIVQTIGVAGSALGPLVLSIGNDAADSYEPVVVGCAAFALGVSLLTLTARPPHSAAAAATQSAPSQG